MKTGLLNENNEFIELPYYEIGLYAEEICRKYIEENEENKIRFESFTADYSFFKPYLDFLLFELVDRRNKIMESLNHIDLLNNGKPRNTPHLNQHTHLMDNVLVYKENKQE